MLQLGGLQLKRRQNVGKAWHFHVSQSIIFSGRRLPTFHGIYWPQLFYWTLSNWLKRVSVAFIGIGVLCQCVERSCMRDRGRRITTCIVAGNWRWNRCPCYGMIIGCSLRLPAHVMLGLFSWSLSIKASCFFLMISMSHSVVNFYRQGVSSIFCQ